MRYCIEGKTLDQLNLELTDSDLTSEDLIFTLLELPDESERERLKMVLSIICDKRKIRGFLKAVKAYEIKTSRYNSEPSGQTSFSGQAFELECGSWIADDDGIRRLTGDYGMVWASKSPVYPEALYYNPFTDEEKVKLRFRSMMNRETSIVCPMKTISSKNSIVALSKNGVSVTSESAGELVKFLNDIITRNSEILPKYTSFSQLGWSPSGFIPYDDKAVFDGADDNKSIYDSVCQDGDFREWIKEITKVRAQSLPVRLAMAASFASPLIAKTGALPFVFHLWGGTGTGKTVALKIAMSIWGNPEIGKLVRTLNMTQNSMLTMASFLNSIPFAGDELQSIKSRFENYDAIIMRLTEGIDRGRLAENGKALATRSWRCSFLFTGEEPCVKSNSGGGVKNRVIEIEINSPMFPGNEGNRISNFVDKNFGFAGRKFIEQIEKKTDLRERFSELFRQVSSVTSTTDKQASSMALMLLADELACESIFPKDKPLRVQDVAEYLSSADEVAVAERAYDYLVDTIFKNLNRFRDAGNNGEIWGAVSTDESSRYALVLPQVCYDLLESEGYSFKAIKEAWHAKNYICKSDDKFTVSTIANGHKHRYVKIYLPDYDAKEDYKITTEDGYLEVPDAFTDF